MNTATIVITENNETIEVRVEHDPLPTNGNASMAARAAHQMIGLFQESVDKDDIVSNTIYDARTGETFTKDASTKQQA